MTFADLGMDCHAALRLLAMTKSQEPVIANEVKQSRLLLQKTPQSGRLNLYENNAISAKLSFRS